MLGRNVLGFFELEHRLDAEKIVLLFEEKVQCEFYIHKIKKQSNIRLFKTVFRFFIQNHTNRSKNIEIKIRNNKMILNDFYKNNQVRVAKTNQCLINQLISQQHWIKPKTISIKYLLTILNIFIPYKMATLPKPTSLVNIFFNDYNLKRKLVFLFYIESKQFLYVNSLLFIRLYRKFTYEYFLGQKNFHKFQILQKLH